MADSHQLRALRKSGTMLDQTIVAVLALVLEGEYERQRKSLSEELPPESQAAAVERTVFVVSPYMPSYIGARHAYVRERYDDALTALRRQRIR